MNKLETQIKALQVNPPDRIGHEVEDSIMESIGGMPSPRILHLRRRRSIVALTTTAACSIVLLVLFQHPSPKALTNTDYVENRVYLPNHTSIWLTPVANQPGDK
jgi:hypothetical protein